MKNKKEISISIILVIIITFMGWLADGSEAAAIGFFYTIAIILIYFGLTIGIVFKKESIEVSEAVDQQLLHAVRNLRARAMRLKFASRISLLLILISLVAGISIFIYADSFAKSNSYYFAREESSQATEAVAREIVQKWLGNSRDREQFKKTISEIIESYKPDKKINEYQKEQAVNIIIRSIQGEIIKDFPDELVTTIESEYKAYMEQTTNKLTNSNSTLISSISTRVGSVFILLFLVQVLVSMYRYNTKLSAFYDSRADVLEIAGKLESVPLEYLADLLSPDGLDFSKEGKGPADQAVELTKHLLSKSGK